MSTSYAWLKLHPILYLEGRIFFYSFQNCLDNWEFFHTTHGCSQASSNIIKYNAHNPSEIQMTKKIHFKLLQKGAKWTLVTVTKAVEFSSRELRRALCPRSSEYFFLEASSGSRWFYVCIQTFLTTLFKFPSLSRLRLTFFYVTTLVQFLPCHE